MPSVNWRNHKTQVKYFTLWNMNFCALRYNIFIFNTLIFYSSYYCFMKKKNRVIGFLNRLNLLNRYLFVVLSGEKHIWCCKLEQSLTNIFLDFHKSFDKVDHENLLNNCNSMALEGLICYWFAFFVKQQNLFYYKIINNFFVK